MVFSRACAYGLRAMLYMAAQPKNQRVLVSETAARLEIPAPFLAKIIQTLSRQSLVDSQKGPGGGVRLGRPIEEITLLQVMEAIDGLGLVEVCVMGMRECSDEVACPLHETWTGLREQIVDMLSDQNIAEVAEQLKKRNIFLVQPTEE